jgi:hypothetical protein
MSPKFRLRLRWVTFVAQDRNRWRPVVSSVMNLQFPRNAGYLLTCRGTVSFSRSTPVRTVSSESDGRQRTAEACHTGAASTELPSDMHTNRR